jgi:hypothetical protein
MCNKINEISSNLQTTSVKILEVIPANLCLVASFFSANPPAGIPLSVIRRFIRGMPLRFAKSNPDPRQGNGFIISAVKLLLEWYCLMVQPTVWYQYEHPTHN